MFDCGGEADAMMKRMLDRDLLDRILESRKEVDPITGTAEEVEGYLNSLTDLRVLLSGENDLYPELNCLWGTMRENAEDAMLYGFSRGVWLAAAHRFASDKPEDLCYDRVMHFARIDIELRTNEEYLREARRAMQSFQRLRGQLELPLRRKLSTVYTEWEERVTTAAQDGFQLGYHFADRLLRWTGCGEEKQEE